MVKRDEIDYYCPEHSIGHLRAIGIRLDRKLANMKAGVYTFHVDINSTTMQSLKEMLNMNNPYVAYLQYILKISNQHITKLSLVICTNIPELD
ncbi:4498_t:CDS:2 [Diversispora eburnea]|uniref:4498_t:CDS:1 n=1 Tax=Diversispora eburnea TaxID=1213867 RepID=A0A9N9G8U7_9GLOM|nr:4498_t:CDS:2 [Diversispora eburnea]